MYINENTLTLALEQLYGTAGHLLKIWFVLKQMGMTEGGQPVEIDTSNSTPALKQLFSCGAADGRFYIPFAHTPRYLTMKHDASRSIVQTTIQRWASSGSVVTCDPTEFLDFSTGTNGKIQVETARKYPFGLGYGEAGFSLNDGSRVQIPIQSFAVWYGKKLNIPEGENPSQYLINYMLIGLNISQAEKDLIFTEDSLIVELRDTALTDNKIFSICEPYIEGRKISSKEIYNESFPQYQKRIQTVVTGINKPSWMRTSPQDDLKALIESGSKSILLFGPPRTGKTRVIDAIVPRTSQDRSSIQIHEGWTYDNLIQGFRPTESGEWAWQNGPLKSAIESGKKFIVLEEINRTSISQSMGEVFLLIEDSYRGQENAVTLRDGKSFWIPEDVVFLMTMNTVDKSTEDIDDALMGRIAAIEFLPRVEDLTAMLEQQEIEAAMRQKIVDLFVEINNLYPLGHGYFAGLNKSVNNSSIIQYYKARIRPVLFNFFGEVREQDLFQIDNVVDALFAKTA